MYMYIYMYRPLRIPSVHPGGLPECPAAGQSAGNRGRDFNLSG